MRKKNFPLGQILILTDATQVLQLAHGDLDVSTFLLSEKIKDWNTSGGMVTTGQNGKALGESVQVRHLRVRGALTA